MQATFFYIFGGLLVVSAVVTAFFGLRNEESFPSSSQLRGLLTYFAVLVIGTMTFAVLNSRANPEEREHNAEAAAKLREVDQARGVEETGNPDDVTPTTPAAPAAAAPAAKPAAGPAQTLKLTSPAGGALMYMPSTLQAKPGTVTLDYDNPSPVPHSIAIDDSTGTQLDASDVGAKGDYTATANLKAGTYTYYCTVPGHREAGMQGTLTVK